MNESEIICESCFKNTQVSLIQSDEESIQTKCVKWLETCETCDSTSRSSTEYASASSKSLECCSLQENNCANSIRVPCSSLVESFDKNCRKVVEKENTIFGNINIQKSKKIHIGNVTYITGPVCFNQNFSLSKKYPTETKILLGNISEQAEHFCQKENTLVVHLNQTIHVRSKSWRAILCDCLVRFMELCMKFVDGA